MDSEDTTVWQRVRRPRLPEGVTEDRRGPQPASAADMLKWLPLLIACVTGIYGYAKQESRTERNSDEIADVRHDFEKHVDKAEDSAAAIWRALNSRGVHQ